ncbi:MAG TPA: hypothetical protein VIW22_01370, partial [Nitrososphaerales archaeon]
LLYRINWPATGPRSQEDLKAWQQQHAHMGLQFVVRGATEAEQQELLTKMVQLPFIWSTGVGEGTFYSEFVVPLEYYSETFQYLAQALLDSRGRTEYFIGDQINALSFTVPPRLYDKETEAWTNNAEEALSRFKNLVLTLRSGG